MRMQQALQKAGGMSPESKESVHLLQDRIVMAFSSM